MQRRKLSLGMIGLLCILGGTSARFIGPAPTNSSEAAGAGAATLIFWIVGITLIVMHFVKQRRQ